jgi:hypothetical protein
MLAALRVLHVDTLRRDGSRAAIEVVGMVLRAGAPLTEIRGLRI